MLSLEPAYQLSPVNCQGKLFSAKQCALTSFLVMSREPACQLSSVMSTVT